jgi:hypothetical protein
MTGLLLLAAFALLVAGFLLGCRFAASHFFTTGWIARRRPGRNALALLILAALLLLVVGNAHARPQAPADWGSLATGADMRRSHLSSVYCRFEMERALAWARNGIWLENRRCW